jgi:hypothetical protein
MYHGQNLFTKIIKTWKKEQATPKGHTDGNKLYDSKDEGAIA